MIKSPQHIILFDGVCNLCNGAVQFLIKKDRKGVFKFASLQSDAGKALLRGVGLPVDQVYSLVYLRGENYFLRSDAALEAARTLGGAWAWLYVLRFVPRFLRDGIYNFIARNRYRWFGSRAACMVPEPQLKERFL